ncbi:MAG: FKBP-type peptidyl-prolyl cis-trans isomerase [Bacteroidia bacterium]
MKVIYFKSILVVILFISACGGKQKQEDLKDPLDEKRMQEMLLDANKDFVHREASDIEAYIKRLDLVVKKTGTGLRYRIDGDSTGKAVVSDSRVKVAYTIQLLDGSICYEVKSDSPRTVHVDHDELISGLHEGLKLMHLNQRAVFIIPSHLAYGLTGDNNKVPPGSALVCNIQIIDFQ